MSMDNVTPIRTREPKASVTDIQNTVRRAQQIIRAVIIAGDHDGTGDFPYALEQVQDLLEAVDDQLSILDNGSPRMRRLRRSLERPDQTPKTG